MKKHFLAIICSAILLLGVGGTASAADVYQPATASSAATIDYQYVLANIPESKSIHESMLKLSADAQKEFEQSVNDKMSPQEIQKVRVRIFTELRQKQINLVKPLQDKINTAIKDVATKHGYSVIVNKDVTLFSSADITEEVLNAVK